LYKNSSIERLFNNPLLKKYLKQVPEKIAKVAINYVLKKAGLGRSSTKLISSGIIGSGKVVYYIVEGSKEKVYNISTVEKMLRGGVAIVSMTFSEFLGGTSSIAYDPPRKKVVEKRAVPSNSKGAIASSSQELMCKVRR